MNWFKFGTLLIVIVGFGLVFFGVVEATSREASMIALLAFVYALATDIELEYSKRNEREK